MPFPELQFSALTLGITLILLASVALFYALSLRRQSGLPSGNVIYSDTETWFEQPEALFDKTLKLAGKPDYLVKGADGGIVPVEVKSSRAPSYPYEGHILQLAAYCRLVEVEFGRRPTHGIIKYQDKAFEVDYTADLEEDLLDIISYMREDLFAPDVGRSHDDHGRCIRCGQRSHCTDRLA